MRLHVRHSVSCSVGELGRRSLGEELSARQHLHCPVLPDGVGLVHPLCPYLIDLVALLLLLLRFALGEGRFHVALAVELTLLKVLALFSSTLSVELEVGNIYDREMKRVPD